MIWTKYKKVQKLRSCCTFFWYLKKPKEVSKVLKMPTITGAKMNIDNGVFSAHCVANFIKGKGSDVVIMLHNINPDTKPTTDLVSTLVHNYGLRVADLGGDGKLFLVCNLDIKGFAEIMAEVTKMKSMEVKVPPKPEPESESESDDEIRCCRGEGCHECMSDDERPAPYVGHDLD